MEPLDNQLSVYDMAGSEDRDMCDPVSLLSLMRIQGVGPTKAIKIADRLGSWSRLNSASDDELMSVAGNKWEELRNISRLEADELPDGIRLVCYFDGEFPELLKKISNPPAVLWVRGSLPQGSTLAI
ncbi:MAG: hypothetical protein CL463_07210, partial [Acidimicrobiaceae bacterium]|nr:hypothetical protein [Acidimicrobiaceae bacterium]